jgi:hypothetical protein
MKFKKGDIIYENCGCIYEVLRVNKKSYSLLVNKAEKLCWNKKDMERHYKEGMLSKKTFKIK